MTDLSAPLTRRGARGGQRPTGQGGRRLPVARLAVAGILILLVAVTARVILVDTPDGGRPAAEVAINSTRNGNSVAGAVAGPGSASIIEIGPEIPAEDAGPPLASSEDGSTLVINGPTTAKTDQEGLVPDLLEETEYGSIPRMSATGETPFAAYARPAPDAAATTGKPMVAIVVTGLGINLSGTLEAIEKLPEPISLAFAPYGKSLDQTVGSARAGGHEIFLEVPLEPFDYPDNDPGPDTLLTGQAPRDNIDKLYRVMGKFGGYAGLINNMGARFTASGADFGPMMEELGARGLGYLDDGSSNRSLAPQLATANRVPFGRADMMLDASPTKASILDQLTALEDKARTQGHAIGLVTALPISVATVAEWVKEAESRGIEIVPVSALMAAAQ